MLQIHKVLFATDFSEASEFALPWAVQFAARHGAALHMLHAIALYDADPSVPTQHYRVLERIYDRMVEVAADRMEAAVAEAVPPGLATKLVQIRGIAPAGVILDYALREDVDLIVLGTHGHRGHREYLLGSASSEVTRLAHCPVLAVGRERHAEVERILVPLDFSESSEVGLEYAKELGAAVGATLVLLHVVEVECYLEVYFGQPIEQVFDLPELEKEAVRRLEERFLAVGGPDIPFETKAVVAHPVHGILDVGESAHADLIVLASHGRTGHQPSLVGSVANGVLRRAPCPLLVVKAFGKSLLP